MGRLLNFWKDEESFARFSSWPDRRNWYKVTIARGKISFPKICPGCLAPNPITPVKIGSREKFGGYYVFFMKWKRMSLEIPYCLRCALIAGNAEHESAWISNFTADTITIALKSKEYADAFRQANGIG